MSIKHIFYRIVERLIQRKINGLNVGWKVKIANKGTISSGKNSYLGSIGNHTVKMVWNGKNSFFDNKGTFRIGNNSRIHKGFGILNMNNLTIGDNTYINPNSIIISKHSVYVGNNCAISWNVTIMDDDLHEVQKFNTLKKSNEIQIGNNVWIGANVFITKECQLVMEPLLPQMLWLLKMFRLMHWQVVIRRGLLMTK